MTLRPIGRRGFLALVGLALLARLIPTPGSPLRRLARAYAALTPEEAAPAVARARLAGVTGGSLARPALRAAVRADFARGDVVEIGGFVLSRSECRYCVAVAG